MTGFARATAGLAFALTALAGLAGCSKRPERPLETGRAERQTQPPIPPAGHISAPDTQAVRSRPDESHRPASPAPSRAPPSEPEPTSNHPASRPKPAEQAPEQIAPEKQIAPIVTGSAAIARDRAETEVPETAPALAAGTAFRATLKDSINSRKQSAGDVVVARIERAVRDKDGRIVVPAGSRVELSITEIEPAKAASPEDARLVLEADSILIKGRPYRVHADVEPVRYQLQGRGVTGKEAGKVGIGAAAGAVLGRVLSGETEGAVVGGAVGAAGGAAVAARRARKDVVVRPGTELVLVLKEPLTLRQ